METVAKYAENALLDELSNSLVEEARFFIYSYNTTTLVTTAGLALGIFFIVTAIALYAYYYSTASAGRSGGNWEYAGNEEDEKYFLYKDVLLLFENFWAMYEATEPSCRERLACEAYLSDAVTKNQDIFDPAGYLREIMRKVTDDLLLAVPRETEAIFRDLRRAALRGLTTNECQELAKACPRISLDGLRNIKTYN